MLTSPLSQAEPLKWTVWPIPGVVNVADGKPTDGITMLALRQLMQRLPELEPDYRLANRLRQQRDMEYGLQFCSTPLFKRPDTDRYAYFVPFLVSTPIQAVVRRDQLEHFPLRDNRLVLSDLLETTDSHVAVSAFRTYPPLIQDWLAVAEPLGRAERISGSLSGSNLLLMVSHGRIDLTFEFATITRAVSSQLQPPEPLLSLPLAEEMELVVSGIYCSGSDWGRAMAEQLDQAIRELLQDPQALEQLLALYADYLPAETWAAFDKKIIAYYRERAEHVTQWPSPTVADSVPESPTPAETIPPPPEPDQ
ncbi:hypothetical protein [Halopseudomonas salegens]|uniref:hypothetical protein n=1 Tax=Halopseudomonas salegens TaxID=1434072 RepID=UPI0012FD8C36|nr:hypothetical protein [Halopseudomonas salegens]